MDAEVIALAFESLISLGLDDLTLKLNSIGEADSRKNYRDALRDFLTPYVSDLSETSQKRFETNPLRILDTKIPDEQKLLQNAPEISDYLHDEDKNHFSEVCDLLKQCSIPYELDSALVRGLDYYRHTAFEFIPDEGSDAASKLGSQSTVLGGGRYDGLMESLGGAATPAVGWAAGIERLAMLVGERDRKEALVSFVVEDDRMISTAQSLLASFRADGFASEIFASGSPRKRYDKAMKLSPSVVVTLNIVDGVEDVGMKAVDETGDRILGEVRDSLLKNINEASPRT